MKRVGRLVQPHIQSRKDTPKRNSVLSLIRHILTFAGGYFVAQGDIDMVEVEEVVAGLMTVLGIAWSIFDKKRIYNEE